MPERRLYDGDQGYYDVHDDLFYGGESLGSAIFGYGIEAAAVMSIGTDYFISTFQADELGGRQLVLSGELADLDITRRIYAPDDFQGEAGEGWVRVLDSFTNNTGAPITTRVLLASNYVSGATTTVLATSSGNQLIGTDDNWVMTVNGESHYLVQLFGDGTRAPDDIATSVHLYNDDQGLGLAYDISVDPGQTVSLLYFFATPGDAALGQEELAGLTVLDSSAIAGLTGEQLASVVNWNTANNRAADETVIATFTEIGGAGAGNWGDGSTGGWGGFVGQTFVAEGTSLAEIRFAMASIGSGGADYTGVTDYRLDVVEWNDGEVGNLVGQTGLLTYDFGDFTRGHNIVTVDMGGIALVEGRTYAFIVNHNYGTNDAGSGDLLAESGTAYADGFRFTGTQSAPNDYDTYVPTSHLDLQFRIVFGPAGAAPPPPPETIVVGNFDAPNRSSQGTWGEWNGGYYGQTFIAEGTELVEVKFNFASYRDDLSPTDYKLVIVRWVDGKPGEIVGSSDLILANAAGDVTVALEGVALTPGEPYAFLLDTTYGNGYAISYFHLADTTTDTYSEGNFVWSHAELSDGSRDPNAYPSYSANGRDMVFQLTFRGNPSAENQAPTLAAPVPDQFRNEDQFLSYTIPFETFADGNDDDLTYAVTLADGSPLPEWLVFVPSARLLSGQPPQHFNGTLDLLVTASDGEASASDTFSLTFTAVNDAPYVFDPIPDQSTTEGSAYAFSFSPEAFSDVDNATLSYSAALEGGGALPGWLVFDAALRRFTGTPPADAQGSYAITVTASDGSLTASDVFVLTVSDAGVPPPTGAVAQNDTFYTIENDVLTGNVFANNGGGFDDPNGGDLTVIAVNGVASNVGTTLFLASGSRVLLDSSGRLTFTPANSYVSLAANAMVSETLSYTLTGGSTASVVIRIIGVDEADTLRGGLGPDRLDGGDFDDVLIGGPGGDELIGGPGSDTASYADEEGAIFVNLMLGMGFGNAAQGDTYNSIENVVGTGYDDWFIGSEGENRIDAGGGDDILIGGLGADELIGGPGTDAVSYADDYGAVFVSLGTGRGFGNAAEGDTYEGIEDVYGSSFGDFIIGSDGPNTLDGGPGDDNLMGGLGPDTLIGGLGNDTVSYADNWGSVFVNLATGRGNNNAAEGDTYDSVENVVGSSFRDVLIGDDGPNRLDGGPGYDELYGNGGADTFVFFDPADTIFAGDIVGDFLSGTDRLEFSQLAFPGLALGQLDPSVFFINDGNYGEKGPEDRIIYTPAVFATSPAALFYDADGSGSGIPVLIALFETGLIDGNVSFTITPSDIFVV